MDSRAITPELMNFQSQMRFFYDLALECNQNCVTSYNSKNLDNAEKECVVACFKKNKAWNDKFMELSANK